MGQKISLVSSFSHIIWKNICIGVPGGGPGGPWLPPWQKYLAWQNRIGWLGRKEIDSLAEKNWKV